MSVNYNVQAEVVDIRADTPKPEDSFLVDTNVWYWLTYSRASLGSQPPFKYQISHYPAYTNAALSSGALVYQSGLSIAELTHIIEKIEREIYISSNTLVGTKEFRHNFIAERKKVVAEVKAACGIVTSLGKPLEINIDPEMITQSLVSMENEQVDGYDMFILQSMRRSNVVQVITDDGDFVSVAGITVFTANTNVIAAASAQGKLITR